jgi:aryl-alcohol dehydrogenase-like predicted oxidoreductase
MEQRKIGNSNLCVSKVGLGCNNFGWRIDLSTARQVVYKALDLGVTFFDTADIYGGGGGSETMLGDLLGSRRNDIVLATKFGMGVTPTSTHYGASRSYIISSIEKSLQRLKTDRIDLYQLHKPDPLIPIEETLRALDDLIQQGKVRYIGCSNLASWQVVEAYWTANKFNLHHFISSQNEYSLLARDIEKELIPALTNYKLGLIPYFPLASGFLCGKYKPNAPLPTGTRLMDSPGLNKRFINDHHWQLLGKLEEFCRKQNHSLVEVALSWLLAHQPVSTVIVGATTAEQVTENCLAANKVLTQEEIHEINSFTQECSLST